MLQRHAGVPEGGGGSGGGGGGGGGLPPGAKLHPAVAHVVLLLLKTSTMNSPREQHRASEVGLRDTLLQLEKATAGTGQAGEDNNLRVLSAELAEALAGGD